MTPTPHMSEAAEANLQSITCHRKDSIYMSPKNLYYNYYLEQ